MKALAAVALTLAAAVLVGTTLAGWASAEGADATADETISFYSSGDVNIKDMWSKLIPKFEASHPGMHVKLTFVLHGTTDTTQLARLVAAEKRKQSSGFDLYDSNVLVDTAALKGNVLEKPTRKQIPNLKNVAANVLTPVKGRGVPYMGSAVVLLYNSAKVKNPPTTLTGLLAWIKANPGQFAYNEPGTSGAGDSFVEAVLNSFIPKAKQKMFFTGYRKGLESYWKKGLASLHELNQDVYRGGAYPNGNEDVLRVMGSGAISMAPMWVDLSLSAQAQGQLPDSVKFVSPKPAFGGGSSYIGVPTHAAHKAAANTFLNWVLSPAVQQQIVTTLNDPPAIRPTLLSMAVRKQHPIATLNAATFANFYTEEFTNDMHQQWHDAVPG